MSEKFCSEANKFASLLDSDNENGLKGALDEFLKTHSQKQITDCISAVARTEHKDTGLDITPLFVNGQLSTVRVNRGILYNDYDI